MKILGMIIAALLVVGTTASAQTTVTCTPTYIHGVAIGETVASGFALGQIVPLGEVWRIEAAGIGTDVNLSELPDFSIGVGDFEALYPVELAPTPYNRHNGTPMMAMTRPLVLKENTRIYGRQNGMAAGENWYLTYYGFSFPKECLGALILGGGGSSSGTVAVSTPPDFSALIAAAQAAATKLTDSAAALTTLSTSVP